MDTFRFKLVLILVAFSFPAISYSALPNQGRYSALKSGIQTMFKFNYGGESFAIEGTAPPETSNVIKLSEKLAAENSPYGGASYTSIQKLKVGAEGNVVGFKVRNAVPKANIVSKLVPALKYLGKGAAGGVAGYAVIEAGTALYDWFTAAGISPDLKVANKIWCVNDTSPYVCRSTASSAATDYASAMGPSWSLTDLSSVSSIQFSATFYSNYYYISVTKTVNQTGVTEPVSASDQELKDRLNDTPIPAGKDGNALAESVVKALAAEAAAKYDAAQTQKDFVPDADPVPEVETPANVALSPVTTVAPDGTVQEVAKELRFSPGPTPDSVSVTERSTVTNTAPNGAVTAKTIDNAPVDSTPQAVPAKVQCDLYPDSLGCASLEISVTPDTVTTTPVSFGISPTSWGSGTCPADVVLNAPFGKTATFSYAPTCQFLSYLSPVLIAIGWITAGWMVIGGVKD